VPAGNGLPKKILAGGTDLYVQQHDSMHAEHIDFLFDEHHLKGITQEGDECVMGASVTAADIAASPVFKEHFPDLERYIKLVSSTPIRNMATLAGNFCNASPIGDFTIFFLALDAHLLLSSGTEKRKIPLRDFYLGYKKLHKAPHESIEKISFRLPSPGSYFNFEKVCKRTYLDIASVNTAIHLTMNGEIIEEAGIAAGGVGPVPMFLRAASNFLKGKKTDDGVIEELLLIIQSEISPISDARGTAAYKRLLLNQLVRAHLMNQALKPA
jgi:xanthine dehydrogenase small subunit